MHEILHIISLSTFITIIFLIVFLLRQRGSYFKSLQTYFVATYLAYATFILAEVFYCWFPSELTTFFVVKIGVSVGLVNAGAMAFATTILYRKMSVRPARFLNKPFLLVIYVGFLLVLFTFTWILTPFKIELVLGFISQEWIYIPVFEPWYMAYIFLVTISYLAYPCTLLLLLGRRAKSKKAGRTLKNFGICFIGITFSILVFHAVLWSMYRLETIDIGNSISIIFFGFIVYLFKDATVLETLSEEAIPRISLGKGDHVMALYTPKADKFRVFSTYIHEGLMDGDKVAYIFPDSDAKMIKRVLREHGVNVEKYVKNGSLILLSTSEWYRDGVYDPEVLNRNVLKEIENARKAGYKHLRTIVDYGDVHQVFKETNQFFNELRKATKRVAQPYLITLRTFNVEALSEEEIRWLKKYGIRNLFISGSFSFEMLDAFSRHLGLKRNDLVGRRILFEFDASSNYEAAVEDFVFEGRANGEAVLVFTHRGSGLQLDLAKKRAVKFFYLTAQVSVPTIGASENEILLPANDTSLLLDALNKTMKTLSYGNINIVFDSLSDLVLSVGFEKAYKFMCYALDMLSSSIVTALFLLNPNAHDPKVTSSVRNLFSDQVTYGKEGLQVIKLHKSII